MKYKAIADNPQEIYRILSSKQVSYIQKRRMVAETLAYTTKEETWLVISCWVLDPDEEEALSFKRYNQIFKPGMDKLVSLVKRVTKEPYQAWCKKFNGSGEASIFCTFNRALSNRYVKQGLITREHEVVWTEGGKEIFSVYRAIQGGKP